MKEKKKKKILTSNSANEVILWHTLGQRAAEVNSIAWSPNGRVIASGTDNGYIHLWEIEPKIECIILTGHDASVRSLDWSPDGLKLASGAEDGTIRLWDPETHDLIQSFNAHKTAIRSIAWSPDGLYLASAGDDRSINVWDPNTGALYQTLAEHHGFVLCLAWSRDGQFIASGASDNTVRLWHVKEGAARPPLKGHWGWLRAIAWSSGGLMLASGGEDGTVHLWEPNKGNLIRILKEDMAPVRSVAWSPDDLILASGTDVGTINLWNTASGILKKTLEEDGGIVLSMDWSPDGHTLASGSIDRAIRLWDAKNWALRQKIKGRSMPVRSVSWSPGGDILAFGDEDKNVCFLDIENQYIPQTLKAHKFLVISVTWSPDGRLLASGGEDGTICLWEVETGKVFRTFKKYGGSVLSLAFSPNARLLASSSDDGRIRVRDVKTGKILQTIEGQCGIILSVAWSPDGKFIASGTYDRTIRIWNQKEGTLRLTLEGHSDWVRSAAWSPDGKIFASAADDDSIRIWRCDTWETVKIFKRPVSRYLTFSISFHSAEPMGKQYREKEILVSAYRLDTEHLTKIVPRDSFVRHVSAKIVLVGESNVGKTCLALRLTKDNYKEQGTTHGIRLWSMYPERIHTGITASSVEKREIVLWDMGGQDEYRLVHQLFLYNTTLALILHDPTRGRTAFEEVEGWNLRLEKQLRGRKAVKLLVGTKLDKKSTIVDRMRLDRLIKTCGFGGYYETSSKTGRGINELHLAISNSIDWENLSRTSRPVLFQRIRDEINRRREKGDILLLCSELEKQIHKEFSGQVDHNAVNVVVEQLSLQGIIADTRLSSGERVLVLQIGEIERYAGSLIVAARNNHRGVPAIEKMTIMSSKTSFTGINESERLERLQERVVLECVIHLLLEHSICFEHEGLLIFPSLFQPTEREESASMPQSVSLYYDFAGAIDNIYSTLVVKLQLSERFGRVRLSQNQAVFEKKGQGWCGLRKAEFRSGFAHLDILFSARTPGNIRDLFTVYVEEHLQKEGVNIVEVLEVRCACGYRFQESSLRKRLSEGKVDIICPECETRTLLSEGAKKARSENPDIEDALLALKTVIARKSQKAINKFKQGYIHMDESEFNQEKIRILQLSDLHFNKQDDPFSVLHPLIMDLEDPKGGLVFDKLDYLVISGDLTNNASDDEFELAYQFVSGLIKRFNLTAERCIIVPGNHDISWDEHVYDWKPKRVSNINDLKKGHYCVQGEGYLIRNEKLYPKRFKNFSQYFFHPLIQKEYPLAFEQQCITYLFEETGIQFITINSAWEIDEWFQDRSSIHKGALVRGLAKANEELKRARDNVQIPRHSSVLRIGVWHHPVTGNDKIKNDIFIDQLRDADVKICLHGHVHESREGLIRYLHPRKMHVVGAGSFGAPVNDRPESTPRLYNLIEIEKNHRSITVHTRCLRKEGGVWEGWAIWPGKNPTERRTYYKIQL